MAKLTLQHLYLGDKYNIIGRRSNERLLAKNGSLVVEERTGLKLLIVKHTIKAYEKMKQNGDYVSNWMSEV